MASGIVERSLGRLRKNSRFYILCFALLGILIVAAYLRIQIPNDRVYIIRLEQVYGFIALFLLYVALIISPLSKQFPNATWMPYLLFARRAIGVSAALYALLHGSVAFWGQLGSLGGVGLLPSRFVMALLFGAVALVVLLIMAATSLDYMVAKMTYRRWKLLHRIVYAASFLIFLHVWIIGTHAQNSWFTWVGFVMLLALYGLESLRIVSAYANWRRNTLSPDMQALIAIGLCAVLMGATLYMTGSVKSYHEQKHSDHSEAIDG